MIMISSLFALRTDECDLESTTEKQDLDSMSSGHIKLVLFDFTPMLHVVYIFTVRNWYQDMFAIE